MDLSVRDPRAPPREQMTMIVAAAALVLAVVGGVWYEVRHDGLGRRPFDPTYNSRVPS